MKSDPRFNCLDKEFWANVRLISQEVGYTSRSDHSIKVPSIREIKKYFTKLKLSVDRICSHDEKPTIFGKLLISYFQYRADALNNEVQHNLMDKNEVAKEFERLKKELKSEASHPMNKQKGEKKKIAYLTSIVNMIIKENIGDIECDFDPRSLTTITENSFPLRTFARRVDGAIPSVTNPIAIWEIKEYYYTTTFGSRVADGVYETLLDGMELEELKYSEKRSVQHYLFIDAKYTWWDCGRSYLCRMIDMINMGYVDEVIFGKEVFKRLPEITKKWKQQLAKKS
jgi:hypothetical protein